MRQKKGLFWENETGGIFRPVLVFLLLLAVLGILVLALGQLMAILERIQNLSGLIDLH